MKIIDLLIKIESGEDLPKKFKYGIHNWVLDRNENYCNDNGTNFEDYMEGILFTCLNDEIKIIEESKEEIEKITIRDDNTLGFPNGSWTSRKMDIAFSHKINELIDHINKLESEKQNGTK